MVVSFVWETAEYVTDGPYASLHPSHFLVLYSASAGIFFIRGLVNLNGNLANGYCCFVSLLVSLLVSVMARGVLSFSK